MSSLQKCASILNQGGREYSPTEVKKVRDLLTRWVTFGRLRRDCEAERGKSERRVEELGHRDSNFLKYLDLGLSLLTGLGY